MLNNLIITLNIVQLYRRCLHDNGLALWTSISCFIVLSLLCICRKYLRTRYNTEKQLSVEVSFIHFLIISLLLDILLTLNFCH